MIVAQIDYQGTAILLGAIASAVVAVWGAYRLYKKVVMPLADTQKKTESEIRIAEEVAADRLDGEAQQRLADQYRKLLDLKDRENGRLDKRITNLEERGRESEVEIRRLVRAEAECKGTLVQIKDTLNTMERRLRRYEKHMPEPPSDSGELPVIHLEHKKEDEVDLGQ